MAKRVLFVAYGGGHAPMAVPVARLLTQTPEVDVCVLALTTGAASFRNAGLPYKGYRDYIRADDTEALRIGEQMALTMHTEGVGIEREESVAYLGMCYYDLIVRYGEQKAAQLWEEKQRHAFYPLTMMERIIDAERPDIVVTTNSPRSEAAAVEIAKRKGIPTLSIADLFCYKDFHVLECDYLCVLNEIAKQNALTEKSATTPQEHIFVTGNPAFDDAIEYNGPVDLQWQSENYPSLTPGKSKVLWIDAPGYFRPGTREMYWRDNDEILHDLDVIADAAAQSNAALFIRPHPSQEPQFFKNWLSTAKGEVYYAGDVPLYPLLNIVDVVGVYNSTVTIQALLAGCSVLQLQYIEGKSDMPLGEWGLAWLARKPEEVAPMLHEALYDESSRQEKQRRVEQTMPQQKAAPAIAKKILEIITSC